MGSLIRESVSAYLADAPANEDTLVGIIGLFEDTGPRPYGDVGEEHDAYLADQGAEAGADAAADASQTGDRSARKRRGRTAP